MQCSKIAQNLFNNRVFEKPPFITTTQIIDE